MSNLILTGAKTLGQNLLQGAGRTGIAYASRAITNAFDNRVFEGPRVDNLHIQFSRDGEPMARVYGKVRIGGLVIWAARVREITREQKRGGKGGGARTREYSYTLSFAIGLCEGEILAVDRIWANGQPLVLTDVNMRLYRGTEDQDPDPLIADIEQGAIPAFRGTAYMVFEDFPLDEFGARLPQFSFEITRIPPRATGEPRLEDLVTGVDLIPGSGEFAYGSTITEQRLGPGSSRAVNMNSVNGRADMDAALDQLQAHLPNCKSVTLLVSWFGDDVRAGHCQLRPGVEHRDKTLSPENWQVNGVTRADAYEVSLVNGRPVYGGTPSDSSIVEAIKNLKARGFKVSLYPFVLMDIGQGNDLPNPYGGIGQGAFGWRGRITCDPAQYQPASADKTAAADTQLANFFGAVQAADFFITGEAVSSPSINENSFRRMILHYAHLANAAGGLDSFVIGSEMRGLTTVRGANGDYPAVQALKILAADVRGILGQHVKLTYAADWSEYFGHHLQDGSNDVNFHLDPLWSDINIDAIGIDAYIPLSDWRDNADHLDGQDYGGIYDYEYLAANMEGGEGYDWYYTDEAARSAQIRTPITDGLAEKPWVFRYKDIRNWWGNAHYNRSGGKEDFVPTQWVPKSKPIWFTEIGCPAIDKGANQPNVFRDPKSSESAAPYYSNRQRDDLVQRAYLETFLRYWNEDGHNPQSDQYTGTMVDMNYAHIWCWDARPYPDFPARLDVWSDGENWQTGHWVNGRTGLVPLADIVSEITHAANGLRPDVSGLPGMVSGFVIDRPMSARAALQPLSLAYGFDLIERAHGLSFTMPKSQEVTHLSKEVLAVDQDAPALAQTREDIQARPKDVRLSFIDPGRDYQSATVYARDQFAQTVRILDVQAPLVFDPVQAKTIAQTLLGHALEQNGTIEFSLKPAHLGFEPGDVIRFDSAKTLWKITDIDGLGQRTARAQKLGTAAAVLNKGVTPKTEKKPLWVSSPDGFVLDLPNVFTARQGTLVGAIVKPWTQCRVETPSGENVLDAPVNIGALLTDLPSGPFGRMDYGASAQIYLPGGRLSMLSLEDMLAGENVLAFETQAGWSILQCQNAHLIGVDTYQISGFLRGLSGTGEAQNGAVAAGARIVDLDAGWQDAAIDAALRGSNIKLAISASGRADKSYAEFVYKGEHLRPLSPVHARAVLNGDSVDISWVRRTRIGGDDWASLDVPLGEAFEAYEADFMQGASILSTLSLRQSRLQMLVSELEGLYGSPLPEMRVKIYQISQTYGRGEGRELSFEI